jgi:hypothetical protein
VVTSSAHWAGVVTPSAITGDPHPDTTVL